MEVCIGVCTYKYVNAHTYKQSQDRAFQKGVPQILFKHTPFLSQNHPHSFHLSLSPSASTLMQKTLMSLWGFATAHFHGKSSVFCLCQHCQVLIIHRDDSQSKAETQMSLCHGAPLDERKHVFILEEEKGRIHTDRPPLPPDSRVHFDDQALSRCIRQWPGGTNATGNRFTDCGNLIVVLNYLPPFVSSWIFHVLKRSLPNLAKRDSWQIMQKVNVTSDIHQLPC